MMCSKPHVPGSANHANATDAQGLAGTQLEPSQSQPNNERNEATGTASGEAVKSNLASRMLSWSMVTAVRFYQRGISPLLGKNCRYQPTCSEYFILAVKKYGPLRGAWRGTWRIMRCHPFRPGGYDPP